MDTLQFLLFDVHQASKVFHYSKYKELSVETAQLILQSTKEWADKDFFPLFREMDEKPVYFKEGKVYSHPHLKNIFKTAGENGFLGGYLDLEDGGSQLPFCVTNATNHILEAANNHIPGYLGLTNGAAHLITSFGGKELSEKFVPNMLAGSWSGTMALTEPQAGSSLSEIKTKAVPKEDGSFSITGQKIFISGGDHQAADNIIHLTLARIEGAPPGTKGISLFVVPKFIEQDGGLHSNHVETVGDFQKLGQRGYSTVHLVFGEKGDTKGYLVGQPNHGLSYMFQMMNGARIDVGLTAASVATAAYYHALQYAKERPQGKRLSNTNDQKTSEDSHVFIVQHPDIRRMLYRQKAIVEGSLSLLLECSVLQDLSLIAEGQEKEKATLLLELFTPVAKTYPSEKGIESVSNGLQVLGGYGYCMDFPLQQYYRDIRIMSIYEGTTGIQSLDLLGRKIPMENGKALSFLWEEISATILEAENFDLLKPHALKLSEAVKDVQKALTHLLPFAKKKEYASFLADATIFMDMFSTMIIAHQWLKTGVNIMSKISWERNDFYYSKWQTIRYFFKYELPHVHGCLQTITNEDQITIDQSTETFLL